MNGAEERLKREERLEKCLQIALDAMCQASFFVKNQKSDLNYAIDKAREALAERKP